MITDAEQSSEEDINIADEERETPEGGDKTAIEAEVELQRSLNRELDDYKHKYLTALADGENARKRLIKERQEGLQHAIRDVILEFLPPIDQLETALFYAESSSSEVRNWAIGFEMILSQFKNVLASHGVEPFESQGKPFDPHYHEAVEIIETTEHPPGTVVKVTLRGYMIGRERVLRPARVAVSREPKEKSEANNNHGASHDNNNQ